ncbi:MFS transporter, partial [Hyphomonas adhaerens]
MDSDTPLLPLTRFQKMMIALGTVSMGAGMTINFVVVAPLAREAGLTEIQIAGILTFSSVLYTVFTPVWGRIADRVGRKRVMVFSLTAMGLANMAFLFALNAALAGLVTGLGAFALLAFVRTWFGFLAPGLQPAAMAAMTDATTPATRAGGLGMLGAAMSLGSILGPAGAAVL